MKLLKLLGYPADHLEGLIPFVAVLVFFAWITYVGPSGFTRAKSPAFKGVSSPACLIDQCSQALDYIDHVKDKFTKKNYMKCFQNRYRFPFEFLPK